MYFMRLARLMLTPPAGMLEPIEYGRTISTVPFLPGRCPRATGQVTISVMWAEARSSPKGENTSSLSASRKSSPVASSTSRPSKPKHELL